MHSLAAVIMGIFQRLRDWAGVPRGGREEFIQEEFSCTGLEALEERIAPALIASMHGGTLTITGDETDNSFSLRGQNDGTLAIITNEMVNGTSALKSFKGVKSLVILTYEGKDTVNFESGVYLPGKLRVNTGADMNTFTANQLTVGGNASIEASGKQKMAYAQNVVSLTDTVIQGSLSIENRDGSGMGSISIKRTSKGISEIGGNLKIVSGINGSGSGMGSGMSVTVGGTPIGGNFTLQTSNWCMTSIFDEFNADAAIKGNLKIQAPGHLTFNSEVFGNAVLSWMGPKDKSSIGGEFDVVGNGLGVPSTIHGNLVIKTFSKESKGMLNFHIGAGGSAGLHVEGNMNIQLKNLNSGGPFLVVVDGKSTFLSDGKPVQLP